MTSEVESNLLELWRNRNDGPIVAKCCQALIEAAPKELGTVELYLPQFAHIVIALPTSVANVAAIERYLLSVSQISIHLVRATGSLRCRRYSCFGCSSHPCRKTDRSAAAAGPSTCTARGS